MLALVYDGPGTRVWKDVPDPVIQDPGDALVRVDAVTICGTDLHILKGDVPDRRPGPRPRPRGRRHRGRDRRGRARRWPRATGCWSPASPRARAAATAARAATGSAWRRRLDPRSPRRRDAGGVRPDALRRHLAAPLPDQVSDEAALMLADILPTSYEVGVLAGTVQPGGHRRDRRRRPDRPGRGAHRPALQPAATSSSSTRSRRGGTPRSGWAPTSPSARPTTCSARSRT